MKEYAVYLDGEECVAYGTVAADSAAEAIPELIDNMYKATEEDGWEFKVVGSQIEMYWNGDWQNTVEVEER